MTKPHRPLDPANFATDLSPATIGEILLIVENVTGIRIALIISKKRSATISQARHLVMHLARKHTEESLASIGAEVGKRDHGTVIHSLKAAGALLETNEAFADRLKRAEKLLRAMRGVIAIPPMPVPPLPIEA